MPKDAARKRPIRKHQHPPGLRYTAARRDLDDPPGLRFDPGWLNLDVTCCPVCGGDSVAWVLRGGPNWPHPPPAPGELTDFIRPADPGFCLECHAGGDGNEPDNWHLTAGVTAGHCPYCGQPPTSSQHLPGIDGKYRQITSRGRYDLVPADGRWHRYQCPGQHWWISAPAFKKVRAQW